MDALAFEIKNVFHPAGIGGVSGYSSLGQLMTYILMILASLATVLSIIFIIVSGIKFITASGDEKKLESAKATLTYAIVGLVALVLVFLALQIVQYILRSNVALT